MRHPYVKPKKERKKLKYFSEQEKSYPLVEKLLHILSVKRGKIKVKAVLGWLFSPH